MKRKHGSHVLMLTLAALACGLWVGCASSDEPASAEAVKQEATEAVDAASDYLGEKQREAQKKFDSQLNEIENRIAELKKNATKTSQTADERWQQTMDSLEAQATELRKKLDAAGDEGSEAWDKLSASIAKGIEELEQGVDKIGDELS